MQDIQKEAIQVSMNYESSTVVPLSDKAPEFSDICFEHIRGIGAGTALLLGGLPESQLEVTVEDVHIEAKNPDILEYARILQK